MDVKVTKLEQGQRDRKVSTYLVTVDGRPVGLLEKWRDTRTTTNPWKAFLLDGSASPPRPNTMLGAFYAADGGREAALAAVVA
jgi:hypothetical protein